MKVMGLASTLIVWGYMACISPMLKLLLPIALTIGVLAVILVTTIKPTR